MAETSKVKTVMVNSEGGISYPENFISTNNIAQTTLIDGANSTFQTAVAGALTQIGETNLIGPVSIENGLKCYSSEDSSDDTFKLYSDVLSSNVIDFIANSADGSMNFDIGHDGGSGDGRLNINSGGQYSILSLTSGGWGDGNDGSSNISIATSKTVDSTIKISNHNEIVPSNPFESTENYYDTDSELYLNNDNYAQLSYKKTYKGPSDETSGMCPICYNNIKLYDNGMDLIHSYDFKRPDGDTESEEWGDNSKIQLSGGLIHLEAGGYPYPPANFININGGGNYTDGIIIQTYNDNGEVGGPIHLNGQVFVNGTSLTDLIGAGSSVDLSNYVANTVKLTGRQEFNIIGGEGKIGVDPEVYDDCYISFMGSSNPPDGLAIHAGAGAIEIEGGNGIDLKGNTGPITLTTDEGNIELNASDNIKMGAYFTAPVYTENDDSSYTKTNKTVALRVVERDGAYTIVID